MPLSPATLSTILAMTDDELRRHLLTCDGRGVAAKDAMLAELLNRRQVATERSFSHLFQCVMDGVAYLWRRERA